MTKESSIQVTREQLQNLLSNDTAFARNCSFVVAEIAPGSCTIEVPYLPHFDRPGGIVSGQVFVMAADVAMWLAIKTLRGLDDASVTSHMQTQFLSSARGEGFSCKATVLSLGRRISFGTAECLSLKGQILTHHTLTYVLPAGH